MNKEETRTRIGQRVKALRLMAERMISTSIIKTAAV